MTNEEIELVKFFINKLDQKHAKIETLSMNDAVAEFKIESVRNEWNKKYGTLQDQMTLVKENYKRDGFVCEESKNILESV